MPLMPSSCRRPGRIALALALLLACAAAASADNYQETNSWWFLNEGNPNWTCSDNSEACYPSGPRYGAFVGLYTVAHGGTLYAYVQGAGVPGPCAPVNGGDNFCVFTTTNTAPGWTGQGVVLVNQKPRPDDGWFWQLRSAFFDPNFNLFYLIASRTISGATNQINEMDAKLGSSTDGIHFTWTTLLTSSMSQIGVRLEDYVLVPHPTQPKVWVGTLGWFTSAGEPFTTPWKVDWNTNTVYIPNSTGQLQAIPVGGTLTFAPQVVSLGRVTNMAVAAGAAGGRLEAWGTAAVSYTQGSGQKFNPCSPAQPPQPTTPGFPNGVATNQYVANRSNPQQVGSTTVNFRVFDPDTLAFTTAWTDITSLVRGMPSDYINAEAYMAYRFAPGGRDYIYTGSKDGVICNSALTASDPWAGSGIIVTKVTYQP